jgi:hypothetical protein
MPENRVSTLSRIPLIVQTRAEEDVFATFQDRRCQMSLNMARHVAATLLFVLFPHLSLAQGLKISGVIHDGAGTPLEGVTVKVGNGKERVAIATSDRKGRFSVSVPRLGQYELEASRGGFAHVQRSVIVERTDRALPLRLTLPVETLRPVPLPPPPPPPPPPPVR